MDIETAKFLFQIAQFVLTCGVGFYVYMSSKDNVTNDRITVLQDDLDDKLDHHGERIARLEQGPRQSDLNDLHDRVTGVATALSEMRGEMKGMNSMLGTIDRYLREGSK